MGLRYAHKVPPLNVKKHKSLMELVVELMLIVELELILMVVLMKMCVLSITAHKHNHASMMQ